MDWGFVDYVPGASNVKGLITGNKGQAVGGLAWKLGQVSGVNGQIDRMLNPGSAYEGLAQGAFGVGQQAQQFSGTQWDRQMQGLQGAMGQMGNSNAFATNAWGSGWTPSSGGVFQNAQNYFGGPSHMGQTYGGLYGQLSGPSAMSGAYGGAQQRVGGTTAQQSLFNNTSIGPSFAAGAYNPNAYNSPGSGERASAWGMGQLAGPGQLEQAAGGLASRMADGGTNLGRLYSENWGGYGTQGRAEGYQPQATGYAQQYAGGAGQRMSGPTSTQQAAGGIADMYRAANFDGGESRNMFRTGAQLADRAGQYFGGATGLQQFAEHNLPEMQREGSFEQFAKQAIAGDNPAIARAREQGMAALNQQLAARGRFNSGAAGFTLGNFASDMAAKEYEFKGQMADRAQQAKMQRLGQAQGMVGAASSERMGQGQGFLGLDQALANNQLARGSALQGLDESQARLRLGQASGLQGLAGQVDDNAFRREDVLSRAAGMASGESLANTGNQMSANEAADRTRLARLAGMSGLAGAADTGNLSQLSAAAGVLGNAQQATNQRVSTMGAMGDLGQRSELGRLAGGMNAASAADAGALGRMGMGLNYAQGADQSSLAAALGLGNMAGQLDAGTLARINAQWGMGQNLDQYGAQGFATLGGLANAYDSQYRGQQGDVFDMLYRGDAARAGLYGGFYGQGGQLSGQSFSDGLSALLAGYGFQAAGAAQNNAVPWNALSYLQSNAQTGMKMFGGGGRG